MKIEKIETQSFKPVKFTITLESPEEVCAITNFFGGVSEDVINNEILSAPDLEIARISMKFSNIVFHHLVN